MTCSVSHWPKVRFSRQQIVPPHDVPLWLVKSGSRDIAVAQTLKQLGSGGMAAQCWIPLAPVARVPHQAVNIGLRTSQPSVITHFLSTFFTSPTQTRLFDPLWLPVITLL
jgi:hypothetical protein